MIRKKKQLRGVKALKSYLVCQLLCDITVLWILRIPQELTVCRIHYCDAKFNDVLLIILADHVGVLCALVNQRAC